jgi:membrane-bound ClpP family serine protease
MGAVGEVVHELAPRGTVLIADEIWTAISEDGTVISVGEKVVVRGLEGVVLTVVRSQRGED